MKIQIVSDLHTEMHRDAGLGFVPELTGSVADVLVLAGDIGSVSDRKGGGLQAFLNGLSSHYKWIIYVPGNHEFYGTSPETGWARLRGLCGYRVIVPQNEIVTIDGQRFFCGTGWFPPSMHPTARLGMNDFFHIRGFEPWVYEQNEEFRELLKYVGPEDIVITHHLPTHDSTSERFKGSPLNDFFISGFQEALGVPKLWIHGHTHDPKDYRVGNTRVVCNPFGYPSEAPAFLQSHLVIDVGTRPR